MLAPLLMPSTMHTDHAKVIRARRGCGSTSSRVASDRGGERAASRLPDDPGEHELEGRRRQRVEDQADHEDGERHLIDRLRGHSAPRASAPLA